MIIIGTREIARKQASGVFFCPDCRQECPYVRKTVQTFLTVYFIPVIPLGKGTEHVECRSCHQAFVPDVLTLSRDAVLEQIEAQYRFFVVHGGVLMAAAGPDGEGVVATIREIHRRLSGEEIPAEAIRRDIETMRAARADAIEFLEGAAQEKLPPTWRRRIAQALFLVANADDVPTPRQMEILQALPKVLEIPDAEYREMIAQAAEAGEDALD